MNGAWGMELMRRAHDLLFILIHEVALSQYVAAVIFVLFGLFIGKLVYVALVGIMDLFRFNMLAEKVGFYESLEGRFNDVPSRLFGRIGYWITLSFFLGAAIDVLQIADVADILAGFAGMVGRILSFAIIVILGDLLGRFIGTVFDIALSLVDHPYAGRSAAVLHITTLAGTAITNLHVLGLDMRTNEGVVLFVLLAIFVLAGGIALIVAFAGRMMTGMRIAERFRIGDRISLPDGRVAVVRALGADHLSVATDQDEWLMPAAWVLDAPIRREEL